MTVELDERPALRPLSDIRPPAPRSLRERGTSRVDGLAGWIAARRADLIVLGLTLLVIAPVAGWNMKLFPEMANDDEGTYVDQAWAVLNWHKLAHYTYWYDHPPLGWIQIAFYGWLTHGFARELWVDVGREYVFVCKLVSCVLIFLVMKRLGYHRITGAAAAVMFALNPFGLQFGRLAFLDNIEVPWLLGALLFALSPTKRLAAAVGSATCLAVAVLSKETAMAFLPGILWALIRNTDRRSRTMVLSFFALTSVTELASYPLYASLKNELFEGPGHVSLQWALEWQLWFRNSGSGSFATRDHAAISGALSWAAYGPWFFIAGIGLLPVAFLCRPLRPVALMVLTGVVILLRGGYLPAGYALAYLPFMALIIAGVAESVWRLARRSPRLRGVAMSACGAALAVALVAVVPGWVGAVRPMLTTDEEMPNYEALAWVDAHVPKTDRIMVGDDTWGDLVQRGYDPVKVVWYYKVNTDPAVERTFDGKGWRAFDYLVDEDHYLEGFSASSPQPTAYYAIINSSVVARFTDPQTKAIVEIWKVDKSGRTAKAGAARQRADQTAAAPAPAAPPAHAATSTKRTRSTPSAPHQAGGAESPGLAPHRRPGAATLPTVPAAPTAPILPGGS